MKKRVNAVIIGAGPSGSSAAAEMAKRGLDVLMVEKDEFPGKSNICAGGIPKTLIKDIGLDPTVVEKEIFGSVFFFPWTVIDNRRAMADNISVRRRIFDNYLAQRAVRAGAKLSCLTLATGVTTEIGKVRAYLRKMNTGESTNVIADLVIFADGPSSLAHKLFGLGFSRTPDKTALGAIYELEWKNNPLECFEHYFYRKVSPWGYGWIFPKKHVANVGVFCLLSKLRKNIRRHLDYLVYEHPIASKKLAGKKILRFGTALIPLAPARKIVGNRMMVVGDAAGMVDPLWGGGIGYAIRSGRSAGHVAVKAFNDSDFSKGFLRQYDLEWNKTEDGRSLQFQYAKLRVMLALSHFNRDAYIRVQGWNLGIPLLKTVESKLVCFNRLLRKRT